VRSTELSVVVSGAATSDVDVAGAAVVVVSDDGESSPEQAAATTAPTARRRANVAGRLGRARRLGIGARVVADR
jgi:hypothetical protein